MKLSTSIILVAPFLLAGCFDDKGAVLAQCQIDVGRDTYAGSYSVPLCMRAKGYEVAGCLNSSSWTEAGCYHKVSWIVSAFDEIRDWFR